ncbi:hypothetical protein IEO21_05249 [Rhodonia placenta]|uniref:Ion transport domain-containing protein n=1 Tax=Rhodonia placenta TaxID=104341 RepID=A0A8H7U1S7_9APHY|nr:hypothetical protein IEO21_05249 [Postia placenta]
MAALSITTVALSLVNGCPTLPFYILELIVNGAMILEVSIRFVAFGRQFWTSWFNIMDLVLTIFCVVTLLVIFFAGCGNTSKEEELLDTLLLVARNILQFGHEDIEDELGRPLIRDAVVFDASEEAAQSRTTLSDMPRAIQAVHDRDMEDVWAELG